MASQADQKEEEMQVFWTYIQGMLTNLETLSLERIHSMLKMFAMIGPGGGGGGGGPVAPAGTGKALTERPMGVDVAEPPPRTFACVPVTLLLLLLLAREATAL
ncbi:unnamed protein product [Lampetra fluviatilis]